MRVLEVTGLGGGWTRVGGGCSRGRGNKRKIVRGDEQRETISNVPAPMLIIARGAAWNQNRDRSLPAGLV